jgi:hypothetical protein
MKTRPQRIETRRVRFQVRGTAPLLVRRFRVPERIV